MGTCESFPKRFIQLLLVVIRFRGVGVDDEYCKEETWDNRGRLRVSKKESGKADRARFDYFIIYIQSSNLNYSVDVSRYD